MCGIAGYIGREDVAPERIEQAMGALRQRGPDGQGAEFFATSQATGGLLHTRLAIIDLDRRASQPMSRAGCTLIFNGEIYNYLEVREELRGLGAVLATASDTEVLLQAYLTWGQAVFKKLEGMWAFALWDSRRRELLLSRDRFAEKPLYYIQEVSGFYFASETRALRALYGQAFTVNNRHLLRYLVHGYKALYKTQETFYKQVREVPFATTLAVGEDLRVRTHRYWTPRYAPNQRPLSETVAATREALVKSMRWRLRSDVPLAFCLSGGVDSGGLVSVAAKELGYQVAAFSIIDNDPWYNETDNIKATVEDTGCQHTALDLTPADVSLQQLRDLVAYHDAPVATITYFIHSLLSRAMAARGYKVVVSGTGADELFTGYFDHWLWHLIEMQSEQAEFLARRAEWEEYIKPMVRNPFLRDLDRYLQNPQERGHIYLDSEVFSSYLTAEWQEAWWEEQYTNSLLRNRMLNELFHEATPVILHEDDLNSMKYSLENRSPYLDTGLFAVAYSTPPEHLMRDGYGKYPLRAALAGILNDQVRLNRRKRGFNASFHSIIDVASSMGREAMLGDSPIFDLVRREAIEPLLTRQPLTNSLSKFLFSFLNAKLWLEQVAQQKTHEVLHEMHHS